MREVRSEIHALRKEKAALGTSPAVQRPGPKPGRPKPPPKQATKPAPKQKQTRAAPKITREDTREMTFDEKRALSENINKLPPEHLGRVAQIVHQSMPQLANSAGDEIEIDIDALNTPTLRNLEKYVKQVLTKQRGTRKGATSKASQSEYSAQSTAKQMDDVKERLKELTGRSTRTRSQRHLDDDNEEVEIDDDETKVYPSILIEKDHGSSSSSSSSSDSSSSDSDSSSSSDSDSSEGEKDSKKKKDKKKPEEIKPNTNSLEVILPAKNGASPTTATSPTPVVPSVEKPEQDQKDTSLGTPVEPKAESAKKDEAPLQILHTTAVTQDVELKNLDSWNMDKMDVEQNSQSEKDETWSQFRNLDALNKQREKEREERERKEKEERELERKRQEELRLKEVQQMEIQKRKQEEEEKLKQQQEIARRREEAKRARQQVASEASQNTVLDQNLIMQDFEQHNSNKPPILDIFKLKDDPSTTSSKEEGQL